MAKARKKGNKMTMEEEVKKVVINQLCDIHGWSPKEAEDAFDKNYEKVCIWSYIITGIFICSFCLLAYGIVLAAY